MAAYRVASHDRYALQVIAVVEQVLTIEHVITGLVFLVYCSWIERIENIHQRKNHPVAPTDGLAPEPPHNVFASVSQAQPVKPLDCKPVALIFCRVSQVPPAAVVTNDIADG